MVLTVADSLLTDSQVYRCLYQSYQFVVFGGKFSEPLVELQSCNDRHQIPAGGKNKRKQKKLTDTAASLYILWTDNKDKLHLS